MGASYLEGTSDCTKISFRPKTLYVEEQKENNRLGETSNQVQASQGKHTYGSSEGTDVEGSQINPGSKLSQHSISSTSAGEKIEGEQSFKIDQDDSPALTENKIEQKMVQVAADRATKALAKNIAEEAEKKVKGS